MVAVALTIAGSDPSGGAGIQADLKTFHQLGVYGAAAVTLITVQNTTRMSRVEVLKPDLVLEQIQAVVEDLRPGAAKTGALGTAEVIAAIAGAQVGCPIVVDPVMISKHGAPLMNIAARTALIELLLPRAVLVTPNVAEASELAGIAITTPGDMRKAAERIAGLGARSVLVKGGHLEGEDAVDILLHEGAFEEFHSKKIPTRHTHGTGCTYSAAITAFLAHGLPLVAAIRNAKLFIEEAIRTNPELGGGSGPVNHWARPSGAG